MSRAKRATEAYAALMWWTANLDNWRRWPGNRRMMASYVRGMRRRLDIRGTSWIGKVTGEVGVDVYGEPSRRGAA